MKSAMTVRAGSMITAAINLGTIRYFTGLVARVSMASICSVTRIVPSSAAMAAPALPATISPVRTGPSSRVIESATTVPTRTSALNLLNPV